MLCCSQCTESVGSRGEHNWARFAKCAGVLAVPTCQPLLPESANNVNSGSSMSIRSDLET